MKAITTVVLAVFLASAAYAADDVLSAVHGTVEKVDSSTKTVVVKTADGTKHSFAYVEQTSVHGVADAGTDSWHGIENGSEVVAHYTKRGGQDTLVEVEKVGKGGLKATTGTVESIDRAGKTVVVKTGDGATKTFHLTDRAAVDARKGIGAGAEKGSKVVVYSGEEAGKSVAHFFEKI